MTDETQEGFCGECGSKNPLKSTFCFKCGKRLTWAGEAAVVEPVVKVPPVANAPKSEEEFIPIPPPTRTTNPRQGIWIWICTLGVGFVLLLGIYSSSDVETPEAGSIKEQVIAKQKTEAAAQVEAQAEQKKQREREQKQKLARIAQENTNKRRMNKLVVKELASYVKAGSNWRNFQIRSNISQEDLIFLAKRLHNDDRNSYFRFVDSDSKFRDFMQWDINYPDSSYRYPEKWANDHIIGIVNEMFGPNGMRWELSDGYEKITSLD